jgi:serine/threonine-protein kinase
MWYAWDWSASEKEFQRALELNPISYAAHEFYAWLQTIQHRTDEALQQARKSVELEPLLPEPQAMYALQLFFAQRYGESLTQLQKAAELDPNYPFVSLIFGFHYIHQGKSSEAVKALQKSHDLFAAPWSHARLAYGYAKAGRKSEARAILDTLRNQALKAYVASDIVASVYVALGDKEKAFEYLEKGYQERAGWMIWLNVDPIWDPIRSDPQFDALLKKMKLQ